jgi:hypothetical protein
MHRQVSVLIIQPDDLPSRTITLFASVWLRQSPTQLPTDVLCRILGYPACSLPSTRTDSILGHLADTRQCSRRVGSMRPLAKCVTS